MKKLGIVAGDGFLPRQLIDHCLNESRPFALVCLKPHADAEIIGDMPALWARMGEAGKIIKYFKENGVDEIVMIGPVSRPSLFEVRPDWWTAKFLARIGFKAFGDDNLLSTIIKEVEKEGFKFVGIHEIMGDILAEKGVFGRIKPDEQAYADIEHGLKIATGLGLLDVGQCVVVQQGIVLGVEAVEGTDALIKRCKDLKRDGAGGILVKIKKPHQEKRVDLPTIGLRTVVNAHDAGLRGIAVHAGQTLVVDRDAVVKKADELGLFIIGVTVREDKK